MSDYHSYRSVFRSDLFAGQTIIVTGGGSGIGRCTAHEIAALGAHVVLLGRKLEKVERVKAEIAVDFVGDLSSALVEAAVAQDAAPVGFDHVL